MLASHVSGGFWLQNPSCITDCFPPNTTLDLEMECMEPCTTDQGFSYRLSGKEHRWPVRLLSRPGGHSGMSGGWRSVAIDHVSGPGIDAACWAQVVASIFGTWLCKACMREGCLLMMSRNAALKQHSHCFCHQWSVDVIWLWFPLQSDAAELSRNVTAVTHKFC